ncbi:C2 family cysteine protease [Brachybacterium sp. YJGR34]|uniref:C2 family cysteine protease n=1 Tax=Brachybacterium sp. YJGR34 TaxID=2059911 RepID=UPI000E0BF22D|nr:C2 family cysteine protease [Brachybacterium sp. YJGR34]
MSFLGADTAQLVQCARRYEARAGDLASTGEWLRSTTAAVSWTGPDAELFRARTHEVCARLIDLEERLRGFAAELDREAEEQNAVSAPEGGAGGGEGAPSRSNTDEGIGRNGDRQPIDEGIPDDDESLSPENLAQGRWGDCGLLASFGALGHMDPEFLRQQVEEGPSGVYTVTMYDEHGDPVTYRIEREILADGATGESGEQTLASIYEEAWMMHNGGDYEALNGIFPEDALEAMTGQPASRYAGDDRPGLEEMATMLDEGRPIVADTAGNEMPDDSRIVGTHAYSVTAVDRENGTVTVVNPWGAEGMDDPNGPQETVEMSIEEFRENFVTTTVGRIGPRGDDGDSGGILGDFGDAIGDAVDDVVDGTTSAFDWMTGN